MSYDSEADKQWEECEEHRTKAMQCSAKIVIDKCSGHEEYEHSSVTHEMFIDLLRLSYVN